jgi:hypothetical protein
MEKKQRFSERTSRSGFGIVDAISFLAVVTVVSEARPVLIGSVPGESLRTLASF